MSKRIRVKAMRNPKKNRKDNSPVVPEECKTLKPKRGLYDHMSDGIDPPIATYKKVDRVVDIFVHKTKEIYLNRSPPTVHYNYLLNADINEDRNPIRIIEKTGIYNPLLG